MFLGIFDLPTYPNQIMQFTKAYLVKSDAAKNLTLYVNASQLNFSKNAPRGE